MTRLCSVYRNNQQDVTV